MFPFLWVPNCPGLSYRNSRLTDSRLLLLITSRHELRGKHRFPLLLYPIAAMETCLFAKPLLSNDCLCWFHCSCLEQICHSIILFSDNFSSSDFPSLLILRPLILKLWSHSLHMKLTHSINPKHNNYSNHLQGRTAVVASNIHSH
jgi:hypothetical protein